ncbi:hypothetical protein [Reichenbachiella sp.]|uniref:hypothetical protein n=1 Tax=Reichenbachiella sp. TaxID=2184521 RepID=UPI00329807E9
MDKILPFVEIILAVTTGGCIIWLIYIKLWKALITVLVATTISAYFFIPIEIEVRPFLDVSLDGNYSEGEKWLTNVKISLKDMKGKRIPLDSVKTKENGFPTFIVDQAGPRTIQAGGTSFWKDFSLLTGIVYVPLQE